MAAVGSTPNHRSQGRAHGLTLAVTMKKLGLILAVLCALGLTVACNASDEQDTTDVAPQPYLDAVSGLLRDTGALHGQILFPSEYAQHSIRFALGDVTFVTHPDGRFRMHRIPAGEHTLSVRIKGYEPVQRPVRIRDSKVHRLGDLRLVEARGRVLGRLVGEGGRSAVGVELHLTPDDGVAVTDGDGIFQFLGVSAGDHVLKVTDTRFFAGNQRFRIVPNEQRNLGNIRVYPQTRAGTRTARLRE